MCEMLRTILLAHIEALLLYICVVSCLMTIELSNHHVVGYVSVAVYLNLFIYELCSVTFACHMRQLLR